jgi:AraC-like DNA-binding protein
VNSLLDSGNFFLHETARQHHWRGAGLLSVKSFRGGVAHYRIKDGEFRVDDGSYLILNHGQEYEIAIDSPTPISSFCAFFETGFAERVARSLTGTTEALLDDPGGPAEAPRLFFQRTYPHDVVLSPVLQHTRESYLLRKDERGWLAEQFHLVMQRLLRVHQLTLREVDAFPAMRAATREELYRRIHLARDFVIASYNQPITLNDIAAVACLSPNHLLRAFKQAFGQTLHQFVIEERLRHAQRLLLTTDRPVTEICLAVGFESPGSFSWLFKRKFGRSPQAFRRQPGDFEEAR